MSLSLKQALAEIGYADIPSFGDAPLTVHTTDSFGGTPLHVAAIWGRIDIAEALLGGGAEIDRRGEHGFTPLHEAISQGHEEMVSFLLSRGADPRLSTELGSSSQLASCNDATEK